MNLLVVPVFEGILLLGVVCGIFRQEAQAMLYLVTNKTDYEGAVQQCIKNGSHLVLPLNETQNMEIAGLLSNDNKKSWLYLYSPNGLITQPSVMKQMTFVNWVQHHPDLSKGMCVRIKKNRRWESTNCSKEESFVCKSGPRPQTPPTLLPPTETNEPDDNIPGRTFEGHGTMRPHIETSSIAPAHRDASLSSSITGPTSEGSTTMRSHIETSSIAPTHRDASPNTGVIIGATMAVLTIIATLVVGVYIMRRRSVSRSSNENACNTYEEVESSFVPDIKDPGMGQGNGYTSVDHDLDNADMHYQALYSPGTDVNDDSAVVQDNDLYSPGSDANDVSAVVQDNDLYSPGSDANDISPVIQDNDLYSPGSDANDVSAVVQDNDLYSPGSDANDDSAVVQDNDLYSPGTDADDVSAVVQDNDLYSPGSDADDVSAVVQDNDLYSPRTDADDVSAVVQDNDLYSPRTDVDDDSAVVQDNDLYSPGTNADDVSAVVQDNDLYSLGTDAEAVNAMITESSHGIDRNVDGISIADNELYSSENDPQPAPVYLELLPLQDATD